MTILFLARRFYPLIGGVEKHVFKLSEALLQKGNKIIVITEHVENLPKYEKIQSLGVEVYRIFGGKENGFKKFRLWREMWKLRRLIKETDVVHCHDVFFWYLPFRFFFPHKPVYTTFHGYESYPISKKAIVIRKLSERLSWGNICIGDFIAKWYGTKPTFVSYGAVEIGARNHESGIKNNKESAIFIGRVDEQTGILTYTKAVKLIRKKYPKFRFLIVGDGMYKKKVVKHAQVTGFQNNPERYYAKYHFSFVSSYLAILEALAAKRLVFAINDNPMKEDYLKMTPFAKYIIIAEAHQELYEQILYYMNHEDEEIKLVEKAYQWVQKQSWEKMAEIYMKLWKNKIE